MTANIDSKATETSPKIDAKSEAVQLFFSDMLSQVVCESKVVLR